MFDKDFENSVNLTIAKNLNKYLDFNHMSQADLARIMNVSTATTSNWCKGIKLPRMDKIDKICSIFGISRSDLMDKKNETSTATIEQRPNRINVYGSVPAGIPIEAIEDIVDFEDIPMEWLKGDQRYIGLRVKGDSMFPKYIEGDTIIVRLQPDCESGQDSVVYVNGYDATLKKIVKNEDGIMLQPLNPEYVPKQYDYNDERYPISILGVVVEIRRKV